MGLETRHQPDSAPSCELTLRAVAAARGRAGEAPLACMWGVQGWALSQARPPVPGACGRGRLPTGCGCGGCGPGHPSPTPQHALLRAGFARFRGGTSASGGGASCLRAGRPRLSALQRPTARSWGMRPGPASHWLWVPGVWAWGSVTNPTVRALPSWLCALWGQHEGARGGGPLAFVGAVRSWALSHARPPVLGACCWGRLLTGCGCGDRVRWDLSPTPQRALSGAGLRAVGAARGRPGGAPLACMWGVRGWALSHPRPPVLGACGQAVRACGAGCPWHTLLCCRSSCVVRASQVCGTCWPLLFGTCPCAVVVASWVPPWRA